MMLDGPDVETNIDIGAHQCGRQATLTISLQLIFRAKIVRRSVRACTRDISEEQILELAKDSQRQHKAA